MILISDVVRRELEQVVRETPLESNDRYELFAAEHVVGGGAFIWWHQGRGFRVYFRPPGMMFPVKIGERWGYLCTMEIARAALELDQVPPPER